MASGNILYLDDSPSKKFINLKDLRECIKANEWRLLNVSIRLYENASSLKKNRKELFQLLLTGRETLPLLEQLKELVSAQLWQALDLCLEMLKDQGRLSGDILETIADILKNDKFYPVLWSIVYPIWLQFDKVSANAWKEAHYESIYQILVDDPDNRSEEEFYVANKNNLDCAIIRYAFRGYEDLVESYVKAGVDVNAIEVFSHSTPLMEASLCGYINIVKYLIKNGAMVFYRANHGKTVLMSAAGARDPQIAMYFLENWEFDINLESKWGYTALACAAVAGHYNVVEKILEKRPDLEVANKIDGGTALFGAVQYGHGNVMRLLLDHGAIVDTEKMRIECHADGDLIDPRELGYKMR